MVSIKFNLFFFICFTFALIDFAQYVATNGSFHEMNIDFIYHLFMKFLVESCWLEIRSRFRMHFNCFISVFMYLKFKSKIDLQIPNYCSSGFKSPLFHILSFSCSFRQKFYKIIGCRTPPLPGSWLTLWEILNQPLY